MRLLILAIAFLCAAPAWADTPTVTNYAQLWSEVDFAGRIDKQWKWQFDAQYSRQGNVDDPDAFRYGAQLTVRPWIHYFPIPNLRLSAFLGVWYNFPIPDVGARGYSELRGAVQGTWYTRWGRHTLMNRLRPEFRAIQDRTGAYEFALRGRYMLKYMRLMNGDDYVKNTFYFIAFDEFFVNGGSAVTGEHWFDQNRAFVGVGWNVTADFALETGYFNQLQQHPHDDGLDMNHIWQVTVIVDGLTGS